MRCAVHGAAIPLAWAASAWAQCSPQWLDGFPSPGVFLGGSGAGYTRALATFDPDGPGPLLERLLVAGQFDNIDGFACRYFAQWDGARWTSTSEAPPGPAEAIAVFNSEFVLGGSFGVRRFDGAAWVQLGSGISGTVEALAVYNGELYAAGQFAGAGGVAGTRGIARWTGSQWQSLGGGLDATGAAFTLLPVADGIVVAGSFASAGGVVSQDVAKWSGSQWVAMPGIPATFARSLGLVEHLGEIYLCGEPALSATQSAIFRWDGSAWTPLPSTSNGRVQALASFGGDLIAMGSFPNFAGVSTPTRAARWDGSAWAALPDAAGLNVRAGSQGIGPAVVFDGELVIGGDSGYSWTPTDTIRWTLLRWSLPDAWRPFANGLDGPVLDAIEFGDDVVLTGGFRVAGGRRCNGVARFAANAFEPMGQGLLAASSTSGSEFGADLEVWNDQLFVAGSMTALDGTAPLGGVARWDGAGWRRTSAATTNNPAAQMFDLCLHDGSLHLTGSGAVGGVTGNVWRYDGAAWSRVGDVGFLSPLCVESADGVLYAGGQDGVRAWNGVDAWTPVPCASYSGTTSGVADLANLDGRLHALADGGFGSSFGVNAVGALVAGTWRPLGSSLVRGDLTQSISAGLAAYHGDVIAGRAFRLTSGTSTLLLSLARYNGVAWTPLAGDLTGFPPGGSTIAGAVRVSSVTRLNDVLWIGGVFGQAGGQPSPYLARYLSSPAPTIARGPSSAAARAGATLAFSIVPDSTPGVEFRWRRHAVPLSEGVPLAGGTIPTGVTTPILTLHAVRGFDAGEFDCVSTNPCGTATSVTATLTVLCPADLDDGSGNGVPDGGVDINDLLYFIAQYEAGNVAVDLDDGSGTGTPDGAVDPNDLLFFLSHYEPGC